MTNQCLLIKCSIFIIVFAHVYCLEETNGLNEQNSVEGIVSIHDLINTEEAIEDTGPVQESDIENAINIDDNAVQLETSTAVETNSSLNDTSNEGNNTDTKVQCIARIAAEGEIPQVKVMNLSSLFKALTPVPNVTNGECAVVLFYSPWCIFSARAAPHFNALARVFPDINFYAIDAVQHTNLHMRYGLISVPTILLFQNGRAVAKFNGSQSNLEKFSSFVNAYTGLPSSGILNVTSADMLGPVPATIEERIDYVLVLSWIFVVLCICIWFLKSSFWHRIVENIKNTWREAEAQHEHVD